VKRIASVGVSGGEDPTPPSSSSPAWSGGTLTSKWSASGCTVSRPGSPAGSGERTARARRLAALRERASGRSCGRTRLDAWEVPGHRGAARIRTWRRGPSSGAPAPGAGVPAPGARASAPVGWTDGGSSRWLAGDSPLGGGAGAMSFRKDRRGAGARTARSEGTTGSPVHPVGADGSGRGVCGGGENANQPASHERDPSRGRPTRRRRPEGHIPTHAPSHSQRRDAA
jgi:hypothetical protein